MSTTVGHSCVVDENPITQIIESLRKEEQAGAVSERRAAQRFPFVRPVQIKLGRGQEPEIEATSRDLSDLGIGLIHDVEVEVGRMGVLTIHRQNGSPLVLRADCRWCQTFCRSWFMSGWRFSAVERR
jgi:hypothetical protein